MLPRARAALAAAILAAIAFGSQSDALAQEKKDKDKDKDKSTKAVATAQENMKKIKVDKPTVVETDNFVIAGSMPEEKAKALGTVLEKTLTLARKTAKYDDKEFAWKGKLTVYFLPDSDQFKALTRRVLQVDPKEGTYIDFRSEPALMVDPGDLTIAKPTDADFYANIAARVAGEHLKAKGTGTQVIPEWLRDGFGRVTAWKATASPKYAAYKATARNAVLGAKGAKPPAIADVWSGEKTPTTEALQTSLAEFLAYGPKAADFGKFLDGLKPSEGNPNPTVQGGFMALGWKDDATTDAAWKRWVQTGK